LLDATPSNPGNDDLAELILKEYKKQVKWKATTKARSELAKALDKEFEKKIKGKMIGFLLDQLPLQQENFEPDTVYTIQDDDHNYDISPVLPESDEEIVNVNSGAIYEIVKERLEDNKELVACMTWGKKFAQFTYIPEYKAKELLGVLFSRAVTGATNTAYALMRALGRQK
jgi:hypothetical protein